jgi:hypothetical protein
LMRSRRCERINSGETQRPTQASPLGSGLSPYPAPSSSRYFSASSAAMQPLAALVTAWR